MSYAPTNLKLAAADYGFAVERVYEAVDAAADVRRDADGTWRVKAGAKVRVKLTLVAPARRYHVALVDPLPAGLEPMNPALAVTGSIPEEQKDRAGELRLVVVAPLVRAPEPARRARRGVHVAAVGGRLHLHLRRARDDARHLRRPAREGRRDVRARDLRPRRERQVDSRVGGSLHLGRKKAGQSLKDCPAFLSLLFEA